MKLDQEIKQAEATVPSEKPTLASRIKDARNSIRISQAELAMRIGVTQSAVGQYERGDIQPSIELMVGLSRELQVSVDWLLGIDNTTVGEIHRAQAKLTELAFLRNLTAAVSDGKLTQNQLWLINEFVKEMISSAKAS